MPVYGNHPDEPGYNTSGFAASRATEAWRWNLDYVVDTHGNTITYFYGKEPGAYGREGDKNKRTTYDRGGYLTKVEYGNRTDAPVTTYAAARVLFDHDDRCVSSCWSGSTAIQASWPDTPWDQYCTAAPCTEQLSPTFWTNQRLNMITTQVQSGTGATYSTVDEISLRHTYLQSGDVGASPMWLRGITRTGKVTTAGGAEATVPEIVFDPGADPLANRVDGPADGRSNLFRYRINTVTTESGAQYGITYSKPECTRGNTPAVASNTKRCFPQYYGPKGEEPTLDWFHKYRVDRIDVYDNTGGFTHEQTNYDYLDTPAWHYDNSELTDEKKRTWSEFRGWGKIRVRTGLESGVQSATEYLYFRGMDDDKQPTGTRDVWITDSQNGTVEDHDAYAGMIREETTLLGVGGSWISGTITTPVKQGPTASSGNLKAWMTNTGTTRSRLKLSTGATRWTKTVTTYNSDNLPTQVDDLGDESTTADDRCTRTWYARNPSTWLLGLPKRTEAVGVDCAATPTLPADMLSSTRTTYDNAANNWDTDLPVYGNVAKTEAIDRWSGTTPTWITTGRWTYDSYGRVDRQLRRPRPQDRHHLQPGHRPGDQRLGQERPRADHHHQLRPGVEPAHRRSSTRTASAPTSPTTDSATSPRSGYPDATKPPTPTRRAPSTPTCCATPPPPPSPPKPTIRSAPATTPPRSPSTTASCAPAKSRLRHPAADGPSPTPSTTPAACSTGPPPPTTTKPTPPRHHRLRRRRHPRRARPDPKRLRRRRTPHRCHLQGRRQRDHQRKVAHDHPLPGREDQRHPTARRCRHHHDHRRPRPHHRAAPVQEPGRRRQRQPPPPSSRPATPTPTATNSPHSSTRRRTPGDTPTTNAAARSATTTPTAAPPPTPTTPPDSSPPPRITARRSSPTPTTTSAGRPPSATAPLPARFEPSGSTTP